LVGQRLILCVKDPAKSCAFVVFKFRELLVFCRSPILNLKYFFLIPEFFKTYKEI